MTSETGSRAALERLLGGPDTAWLVERLRARILASRGEPLVGVVALRHPSAAQRSAIVRLIGPAVRTATTLRVDLSTLEEVLRRGPWPAGLANAVETLSGAIVDGPAERRVEAAAWEAARASLSAAAAPFPGLPGWWDEWCAGGGLKRCSHAEAVRTGQPAGPEVAAGLVRHVVRVLALLPADGEPLAVFARRVIGDAHAFDSARPLGRLAATVVGRAFGLDQDAPVREKWAAAGVLLSTVASTVLCLGVPGAPPSAGLRRGSRGAATAAVLDAMRVARMPVVLTLDQVRSGGIGELLPPKRIYVCENPTVVEVVANRWVASSAESDNRGQVIVCTWGQPSTAVVELLMILGRAGAPCYYHGDFDWPGLRIAGALRDRVPWTPWRYTAADYRVSAGDGMLALPLVGQPATSPWDPALAAAMEERGVAVEEESEADLLAGDFLTGTTPTEASPA